VTDCGGGRLCPGCHPLRAAAVYVVAIAAYMAILVLGLRWMP